MRGDQAIDGNSEVAVIGIGCRFPGAHNLHEFWRVLSNGEDHIREFPSDRWVVDDFYDPDPQAGKSYTNKAGFISNFADFDHKLFGIGETEASQMDPQQRQVLECTYMALENAGITREQISGQKVGVYIGSMNADYQLAVLSFSEVVDQYSVAGMASSVISNRVSYTFNLTGPSMTIDTACSSSLVAIHQAILALKAGDCTMAICGGVNLLLHPDTFVSLSKAQMLSPTGRSDAFASTADGYTRGEGCGILILKALHQAQSDCDNIWGSVVTGLNQDGRFAQPITAPSQGQQEQLLTEVFRKNMIDPATVKYIEAHGTGTKRGDPVEANAFGSFFIKHGEERQRYIGSVKTNIGHLESAAGVAGLIKIFLMMKHSTIVPSLHFDQPNELIDFAKFHFTVPTKCHPWNDDVKVSCLNSFGFGGANSHAIVKSVSLRPGPTHTNGRFKGIVCFSGTTDKGLRESMKDFLTSDGDGDLPSVVNTTLTRREHYKFRKMFTVDSLKHLKVKVDQFLSEEHVLLETTTRENAQLVFVYCGMGTAWNGMCRDLLKKYEVFKQAISRIDDSLRRFVSWSLLERMVESYDVEDKLFGPIAIFATQVALSQLWMSWGIKPNTVLGQSIGEVAAAHIAGVLSLDAAVKVIYHRSNILSTATGGKMILIRHLSTQKVETMCKAYEGRISIALYYSPVSCTVSGDADAVEDFKKEMTQLQTENPAVDIIDLKLSSAFHSHHMEQCQKQMDEVLKDLKTEEPSTHMISTVDPSYDKKDIMSSSYWGQNVRQPVQLHEAVTALQETDSTIFVEIGPHSVLKAHIGNIFQGKEKAVSLASMRRNGDGTEILESLAVLFENNNNINWKAFVDDKSLTSSVPAPVPRYSFNHKTLWNLKPVSNQLLGRNISTEHLYVKQTKHQENYTLNIKSTKFCTVFEHKVNDVIVIPGATYAEVGFSIANLAGLGNPFNAEVSVHFSSPVTLQQGRNTDLDIDITLTSSTEALFKVIKGEVTHAEGNVIVHDVPVDDERIDVETIQQRCRHRLEGRIVYDRLKQSGFTYGSNFATIDHAFKGEGEALAMLKMSSQLQSEMKYTHLHPAVLDGLLQTAALLLPPAGEFLPVELRNITLCHPLKSEMVVYSKLLGVSNKRTSFFMCLLSLDGTVIAQVREFVLELYDHLSFDPKQTAFVKTCREICLQGVADVDVEETVLITSKNVSGFDVNMKIVPLHTICMSMIEEFGNAILNSKRICVLFPIPEIQQLSDGRQLADELYKRVAALRLMVLFLSNKQCDIPMVVLVEETEPGDPYGVEAATICLNEAVGAFCRCVQREYITQDLTYAVLQVQVTRDYVSFIQETLKNLSREAMKNVSDIQITSKGSTTVEMVPGPAEVPRYRYNRHSDLGIVCSKSTKAVYDPSFVLKPSIVSEENQSSLTVTQAVLHSPNLHIVTVPQDKTFGSSEDNMSPVLTLECICKHQNEKSDVLVCYPLELQKNISVSTHCTVNRKHLPSYEPGDLLKLYILWSMCRKAKNSSVAIVNHPTSEPLAKALKVVLKSLSSKMVSLISIDETDHVQPSCQTLISTTSLSEWNLPSLSGSSNRFKKVIVLQKITTENTLCRLKSTNGLKVVTLIASDMFSPGVMKKVAAELIRWIKGNPKAVWKVLQYLHQCTFPDLQGAKPIKLAEILYTETFTFRNDMNMTVPEKDIIRKANSYLVVGGLTGLGWECVCYLASKGAGEVIIFNRRIPDEDSIRKMNQLRKAHGCVITSVQSDVTQCDKLTASLNQLKGNLSQRPLAGVFFGAGVLIDGSLLELSEERFMKCLLPKVAGSWNLHCLLENTKTEIFLMHSSAASVIGNPGQANYGTGNGFMDGLANCRRRVGLSGQSVNWGPLQLGMLENQDLLIKRLQRAGFDSIQKKDIGSCLSYLLLVNEPQMAMVKIDRRKMADSLIQNQETVLLTRLQSFLKPVLKGSLKTGMSQSFDMERLKRCTEDEATEMTQEYLKQLACDKALLDEKTYDMDLEMKAQGVDSMYAMEISGQVAKETGVKLSAREIQIQSTIALSKLMVNRILTCSELESTDYDSVIRRSEILQSIADSFFWVDTDEADMSQILKCTIHAPGEVDSSIMIEKLKGYMAQHKLVRSILASRDTLELKVMEVEEAFDFQELSEDSEMEKPINLKNHAPLKFFFKRASKHLVIFFHKFVFDISSIRSFVNSMYDTSGHQGNTADPDIAKEIQKVVAPQFHILQEFWKTNLSVIPNSSLVFAESENSFNTANEVTVTRLLERKVFLKLTDFISENGLTPFECFVSLYQLLLCILGKTSSSAVTTSFDMRTSIPALVNSVGRCTNLVPLICQTAVVAETLKEFLDRNRRLLSTFLENGIMPFNTIKNLIPGDQAERISKHFFIFEDDWMTTMNNELKVEQTVAFPVGSESLIYVWHRKNVQTVELRMHLNPSSYTPQHGEMILSSYVHLLQNMLDNPDTTLSSLKQGSGSSPKTHLSAVSKHAKEPVVGKRALDMKPGACTLM